MMGFGLPENSGGATGATGATGHCCSTCSGRCYSPLCNRGVAAAHRNRTGGRPIKAGCSTSTGKRKAKPLPEPWPPGDSRAGRIARILGTGPGVVTGDPIHNAVSQPPIPEENAAFPAGVAGSVAQRIKIPCCSGGEKRVILHPAGRAFQAPSGRKT